MRWIPVLESFAFAALFDVPIGAQQPGQAAPEGGPVKIEEQAVEAQEQQERTTINRSPRAAATDPRDDGVPEGEPDEASDVVVTGYRASLATAQQLKRDSDAILDTVVSEDIGKLPDNNTAESLARISGVQVDRAGDEANNVLVRGLPNVITTFNGRDIFTATSRRTTLQDFPSGGVAGLEVYKSGTADLLEPGLAGLINIRSRRPFDFDGFRLAGLVRGSYNDQAEKVNFNGNILISDRAETLIGEVGVLVNASYFEANFRNANRIALANIPSPFNPAAVVDPSSVGRNFRFPAQVQVFYDSGVRRRPSVNASVQWKPAANLEIYYDFLFAGLRAERENDTFGAPLNVTGSAPLTPPPGFVAPPPRFSNIVFVDGKPDQVRSLTKTSGQRPEMIRNAEDRKTDIYQIAGGIKWRIGDARLSSDLAYTRSSYRISNGSFDTAFAAPTRVDIDYFVDGGAAFSLPEFDAANPENYIWRGYFNSDNLGSSSGWQWRADLDLDTGLSLLPALQTGVRYTDRDVLQQQGSRYASTELLRIPLASLGLGDLELVPDTFRTQTQGFRSWLMPTREGIAGNAARLRQLSIDSLQRLIAARPTDQGFRSNLLLFQPEDVQFNPAAGFSANEKTYTFYGQTKYAFETGGLRVDGLLGARVVNTVGAYSGTSSLVFDGVTSQVLQTINQNYVDVLPNASMRIRPWSKLQLRLAYTKTRTQPGFDQLNPALTLTQNVTPIDPNATEPRADAFGSAGNPDLQPLTSKNYDASLEWYFSRNGSLTAAVFYRDLFGFIGDYTRRIVDPVYGLIQVSRPENAGSGKIKGVEIAGQSFFDFLPGLLSGFGVQGNLTYLDGKNQLPATLGADQPLVRIPNVSKWSYNAALFYEKGPVSTRLSFNRRTAFVTNYTQVNGAAGFFGEMVRPVSRLDYSLAITPLPWLTITAEAANLLAQPYRRYIVYAPDRSYPRELREEGRIFSLGTRFRF